MDQQQDIIEYAKLMTELERRRKMNKLAQYRPYPKQKEFHDAGYNHRERLLMASNQSGKTYCGAAELAIHLTGRYPDWWKGRVFNKPIRAWASSKTGFVTRDGPQRMLVGEPKEREAWGSGLIPGECIERTILKHGIMDALDGMVIKHESGDFSTIGYKSYDQGREPWQAETLDVLWLDEEPPMDVYMEGLTRTNATDGMVYLTFTPLLGVSEVVRMFLEADRAESESNAA